MRVSIAVLIGVISITGDVVFAQGSNTTVCGRVVSVSCTHNYSEIRIKLSERMRGASWTATIPASRRSLFDARFLTGLEDADVCISTAGRSIGRDVALLRPDDLVITGDSTLFRDQGDAAHSCDGDVAMPALVHEVKASMTADAMRAKVSGSVVLRAIVDITGAVRDVRVTQSLEPSQDEACRDAVAKWIFKPARRDGEPVPMRISVEMHFTLR